MNQPKDFKSLLEEIDDLKDIYLQCRSVFPRMSENDKGKRKGSTAHFYQNLGYNVKLDFGKPLTNDDIHRLNKIGDWINRSFIIYLVSMLEYYQIISDIDKLDDTIDGHDEVDILRRLRNIFSHKTGNYNPDNPEEKNLVDRIIKYFNLNIVKPDGFPIPVNTVIMPLCEGIKKYIKIKFTNNEK